MNSDLDVRFSFFNELIDRVRNDENPVESLKFEVEVMHCRYVENDILRDDVEIFSYFERNQHIRVELNTSIVEIVIRIGYVSICG